MLIRIAAFIASRTCEMASATLAPARTSAAERAIISENYF
jgi:hypothetical protein